ncbi:hypothetical protein [Geothrix terrae]|uniref:hypothetical protein n=1 Tax=Geothrix terrae TaxID=2922720 RepID=UPI001FAD5E25|nr:hypothetical protein [Geothrix terrae]
MYITNPRVAQMAQELLVGEYLTSDMINSGAALITALDRLNLMVKGAFWLLLPDQKNWRLVIASPEVRLHGPKAVYRKITMAIKKIPRNITPVGMKDVSVVEDKNPIFLMIRTVISTGPGISGIRFSRNVINGQLVEDAYIYRAIH